MTFPVALPLRRTKHRAHTVRDAVKRAFTHVRRQESVRKLAEMPMTVTGIGTIAAGILMLTTVGGLMFIGLALIGLEYLIADE